MIGAEPEIVGRPVEEGRAASEPVPSSPSLRQALGLVAVVVGLLVAAAACACGPLTTLLTALTLEGALAGPSIQQGLALTVLGVVLALPLVVEGWRVWRGQPSRPFFPRRTWLLWVVLLPLLAAGLLVSLLDLVPGYLLPPINTLTLLLLPALILGAVGRALRGTGGTWRDVIGGLISGASIGAGLAIVVEIGLIVLLVIGVTAALALGVIPGGLDRLETLAERLEDPALLSDPQPLLELLTPAVALAAFAFLAVVTPLVEETTKTLGMGIAGLWLRPVPARAFLLGLASGAGFALAENLLNGAILGAEWGLGIVSRLAATVMHCAVGGLMGWGWGEFWAGKRRVRLALAFFGAVGLHGVWNGLAVGAAMSALVTAGQPSSSPELMVGTVLMLVLGAALFFLALAMLVGTLWAARTLAQQQEEL